MTDYISCGPNGLFRARLKAVWRCERGAQVEYMGGYASQHDAEQFARYFAYRLPGESFNDWSK